MFLEIENKLINLDNVTTISVNKVAQELWNVQVEAEKGNVVYSSKDFNNEKDAIDLCDQFSTLLKPVKLQ